MIPYYLLMLIVVINLFFYKLTKNKFFIRVIFLFLVLFSGFRVDVGVDYSSYVIGFNNIISGYPSDFEIGMRAIIRIIDALGYGPQTFFVITAAITNLFIYLFILRHSRNLVLSVAVYFFITLFFLASFNAVRQYLAISIGLYSLRFILERSFFKYILCVILGSFFHVSAILTLPLYFFIHRKYSLGMLIVGGGGALVFLYISLVYLSSFLFNSSYLNFENSTTSKSLVVIFIIFNVFLLATIRDGFDDVVLFKNMLFISILLLILALCFPVFSMGLIRVNSFYLFAIIPIFSYFSSCNRLSFNNQLVVISILVFSIFYYLYIIFTKGEMYKLVPYAI